MSLNDRQIAAVTYRGRHLMVNAGPGAGKTRVIIERVMYLADLYPGSRFLLLTFTNHAADVMKRRIFENNGTHNIHDGNIHDGNIHDGNIHASTFHSFCHRVLVANGHMYTIIDDDDQLAIISRLINDHGLMISPGSAQEKINYIKSTGQQVPEKLLPLYNAYNDYNKEHRYKDFGDLQLDALQYIGSCVYDHVLVDEFHDSSPVQMEIVRLLEPNCRTLTVVCDDQQSIYGWRGADIYNILKFREHYPDTELVVLNRNYRSTKAIVQCINNLITHADEKLCDKDLYSERRYGVPVHVTECENDDEEARLVAQRIEKVHERTGKYSNNLVLYRTNSQSRAMEQALVEAGIPYKVADSLSFYRRKEVKDAIAFMRYVVSPDDEVALRRIINVPARGIGKTTVNRLIDEYGELHRAVQLTDHPKVSDLRALMDSIRDEVAGLHAGAALSLVLERTGYLGHLRADDSHSGASRLGNVESLISNATQLGCERGYTMADYLAMVALVSDIDGIGHASDDAGAAVLMTIHSSKGLEYDYVHIIGVDNYTLPHRASDISEERRLFYVAVSRAREMCLVTYAKRRVIGGKFMFTGASVFIDELNYPKRR